MKSLTLLTLVISCLLHNCFSGESPLVRRETSGDASSDSMSASLMDGWLPSDLVRALNFLDIGESSCSWDSKPDTPIATQRVFDHSLWGFAEHALISGQPAREIDYLLVQKNALGFRANVEEVTVSDGLSKSSCTVRETDVKPLRITEDEFDRYTISEGFSIKEKGIFAALIKRDGNGTLAVGAIGNPSLAVAVYYKAGTYYRRYEISSVDRVEFVDPHVDDIVVVAPRKTLEYIKLPSSLSLEELAKKIYDEQPDIVSVSRIAYNKSVVMPKKRRVPSPSQGTDLPTIAEATEDGRVKLFNRGKENYPPLPLDIAAPTKTLEKRADRRKPSTKAHTMSAASPKMPANRRRESAYAHKTPANTHKTPATLPQTPVASSTLKSPNGLKAESAPFVPGKFLKH
ncbi:hypothetical protein PSACC_00013 [Paramicrosporidium saccamoebae]|uniref:Uncharacterized protein n=1 Tax=Paramicrosporidium saccamoebae TaxID=1246581 RepID=A0A2H9TQZ2_9FUNG|nr:hypothetical protein PSACC_00013 [Paramicrosporidium saccamoebae]